MVSSYNELEFTHFIIDNSDGTIFGSARVNGSGRIANFLINGQDIKQQSGDNWQLLEETAAGTVRSKASAAYGRVHTYRTGRLLLS